MEPNDVIKKTSESDKASLAQEFELAGFHQAIYAIINNIEYQLSKSFSIIWCSNNRWGYFPAFSAGWIISDENFLKVKANDFIKAFG